MSADEAVQAVMDVLGCKESIRQAFGVTCCLEHGYPWKPEGCRVAIAAVAAARPLIAAEALRAAADLVGGSSGPRHGVKMPDEQEWAQWLYDRADRLERGADQ